MATKLITILCEGPHDVAFLTKILRTIGFRNNEKLKLGEFPQPVSGLLVNEASKSNVEDLNLQELRHAILPMNTMQQGDKYIFLYALGGDGKVALRKQIVKDFHSFIPKVGEINLIPPDTELSIVYFFDADQHGIPNRINYINNELSSIIGIRPFANNSEIINANGLRIGLYIFTGEDNNTGKLEDILLPLLKDGNDKIFDDAGIYLQSNYDITRGHIDYNQIKSLIGIAGQLQKSGSTNTVIISQTDYLTSAKINVSQKCSEIAAFFNII